MDVFSQQVGLWLGGPAMAFVLTLAGMPLASRLATRWRCVALPRKERWHAKPTPMLGGLAFFAGFVVPAVVLSPDLRAVLPVLLVVTEMFLVGLYDDLRRIHPTTKLIGQIIAAATALSFGYYLKFFTWAPLDAVLTAVWIIGLTNALNLLDNMDGLAGGIGLIAAGYLAFLFIQQGDSSYALLALLLCGALAGFLLHNFYPASIFMGDAGSLFVGSALSILTIRANGQASNILTLVAVPTCILLVPILDTAMVTITRLLRGQPISQGGRDHTSHRLVTLGLSESQAVLLLYILALIAGASALFIKRFSYTLSLAVFPLVIFSFALFTAYLAGVKIVTPGTQPEDSPKKRLAIVLSALAYRGGMLELILDFFIIGFAYYLAFALRYDFHLSEGLLNLFVVSLPIVLAATYVAFFFSGVYSGLWHSAGLHDLVAVAKGAVFATVVAVTALIFFYRFQGYSRVVFVLYSLLVFLGVTASRLSFRLFGLLLDDWQNKKIPVLIYGAGHGGELVVRECRANASVDYQPVGFLDDDPTKKGRSVLGLRIYGGVESLPEILKRKSVRGCIVSTPEIMANGHAAQLRLECQGRGLWIKQLRLEFVEDGADPL